MERLMARNQVRIVQNLLLNYLLAVARQELIMEMEQIP